MDVSAFRTDPSLEESGVWIEVGGDAEMLLARWNNPKCREAMAKYAKEFVLDVAQGSDPITELKDEKSVRMLANIIADSILLDWRGNFRFQGELLEYSREACYTLMADPTLHDLREIVLNYSSNREHYLLKKEKELVGN